jgi:hypothetical protein
MIERLKNKVFRSRNIGKVLRCFEFQKKYYCIFILVLLLIIVIYYYPNPLITIGDILNKYSGAVVALSTILGVIFGSSWLDTSKKKMKGKLNHDIAREYLKAVLKLRDAVKIVRNPFIPIDEMLVALEKNGFKKEDYEDSKKVNRSVYFLRWNKVQEVWTNFEEILTEAEVSWGSDAIKIQKELDRLIRELRSIIWLFINYSESFHKEGEKNEKILYGTYDENDEFAKNINIEIEKIKFFLGEYL